MDKQTLKQYQHLLKEIEQLEEERARLLAGLEHGPAADGQLRGGSGVSDPTGNIASRRADLARQIGELVAALYQLRLEIEQAITALPAQERTLLRLRYIEGWEWPSIADELNYNLRWIYRLHNRALKKIGHSRPLGSVV